MEKQESRGNGGIGFWGLLLIVMITLKLTGFLVEWSWFWVLFPLWIPLAIVIFLLILLVGLK